MYKRQPLLGAVVFLSKALIYKKARVIVFLYYFTLMIGLIKISSSVYNDNPTYTNSSTYIATFIIIVVILYLYKVYPKVLLWFKPLVDFTDKISFAFYLLHVHFGIITIYVLRLYNINAYISVFMAYTISIIVSILVSKLSRYIVSFDMYKKGLLSYKK